MKNLRIGVKKYVTSKEETTVAADTVAWLDKQDSNLGIGVGILTSQSNAGNLWDQIRLLANW
jgi:hypothetical protein